MVFWDVPGVMWWMDNNILEETVASFRIKGQIIQLQIK